MTRPKPFLGVTSPYPTVVTVWSDHQAASPKLSKSLGSNNQTRRAPAIVVITVARTITRTALRTDAGLSRNLRTERTTGRGTLTLANRRAPTPTARHPARVKRSVSGIALDGAGHAVRAAAATAQLEAFDRDDLDAGLAQRGVGAHVAFVGDDDAGLESHDVVAVVPLLALRRQRVTARFDHAHGADAQHLPHE